MKEIIFYVLMTLNHNMQGAVWTYSGPMTESQCQMLKQAVLAEKFPGDWSNPPIGVPRIAKCVSVGPTKF